MFGNHPFAGLPFAAIDEELFSGLAVEIGSYTISGNAVALRVGYKIPATFGSYSFSGKDIEFTLSVSQAAIHQIPLVGSTSIRTSGFKMITNFVMTAGDNKILVVTVRDANASPVNITGSTIKWQCARSYGKASVISKSTATDDGILITDGANGRFTVTLNADDTEDLVGNFVHEAQVTATDGTISTVLKGTMKVNPALIEAT